MSVPAGDVCRSDSIFQGIQDGFDRLIQFCLPETGRLEIRIDLGSITNCFRFLTTPSRQIRVNVCLATARKSLFNRVTLLL